MLHLNRLDEAEAPLRQALKLGPNFTNGYLLLAELMVKKEQWEEAASLVNSALKLAPGDAPSHMVLADVFSHTGKLKDAERELRDALRFQPNDPAVLNNLGYFLVDHDKDLTEAFKMIEPPDPIRGRAFWTVQITPFTFTFSW